MLFRHSLRVRVLVAVLLPTMSLLGLVVWQVSDRVAIARAASEELDRTEALETLAAVQAENALPEAAEVWNRLQAGGSRSPLGAMVGEMTAAVVIPELAAADSNRSLLSPGARTFVGDRMAVFDRQRAANDALVEALGRGGTVEPSVLAEAAAARAAADVTFADLALESDSAAWLIYVGVVDAVRTGVVEFLHLVPTLIGLDVASSEDLAELAGRRAQATERTLLALESDLRAAVLAALESDPTTRWEAAGRQARAVAAGTGEPADVFEALALVEDASALEIVIQAIAGEAVARVRADLTATAERADLQRRQLLFLAAALVAATLTFGLVLLRSILVPLQRLTERAAAVAGGDLSGPPLQLTGRDELTRLGSTIEQVVDGLQHLERQIHAMADGALDDPSLATVAPGPVGATVHQRVDELRRASEAWRSGATEDPLTGLLNRRGFAEAMAGLAPAGPLALVYVDLDRFKAVNDSHGHRHGDAVLQEVAARLTAIVRPDDPVCRLGGDEFALLVDGFEPGTIGALVARVEHLVALPITFEGRTHQIGGSVGVAWLDPQAGPRDGDGPALVRALDAALDQADRAMLAVKTSRRSASTR